MAQLQSRCSGDHRRRGVVEASSCFAKTMVCESHDDEFAFVVGVQ